ncbi:MAG: metal ABC transporter permease [Pirellulaceae bacterium]
MMTGRPKSALTVVQRARRKSDRLSTWCYMFLAVSLLFSVIGIAAISEAWRPLMKWDAIDNTMVLASVLVAVACSVPGCFLVVRKQSMMGDAISHAALPGVVIAFLLAYMFAGEDHDAESFETIKRSMMFGGAVFVGVLCTLLTESVQRLGRVEGNAALGVVFTSLFAIGLLLMRAKADDVHIDPDCVLYGSVENIALEAYLTGQIPSAIWVNTIALAINVFLVVLLFKELRISAFDPTLATTVGINSRMLHYGLMTVTAITLVAAFETVGSILVVAMLIAPAATAYLLTDRLSWMIVLAMIIAAAAAVVGHASAIVVPDLVLRPLGINSVESVSSTGMTATVIGGFFLIAIFFAPRHGTVSRALNRVKLAIRIAEEDVLGELFRRVERRDTTAISAVLERLGQLHRRGWLNRFALRNLVSADAVRRDDDALHLTEEGVLWAGDVVSSHRLWESYMSKHFALDDDHLHEAAERVEHFLDDEMRSRLRDELGDVDVDPHGRDIP